MELELVSFGAVMIICGAVEAIVYYSPGDKLADSSFAAKYPLLGVVSFFCLVSAIYWLFIMAEKEIWQVCYGTIVLILSYLATKQIYKEIMGNK